MKFDPASIDRFTGAYTRNIEVRTPVMLAHATVSDANLSAPCCHMCRPQADDEPDGTMVFFRGARCEGEAMDEQNRQVSCEHNTDNTVTFAIIVFLFA